MSSKNLRTGNNTLNQGVQIASNSNSKGIKDISAEVYVAVDGEDPNRNVYIENLITAVGVIASLSEADSYFGTGKALFSQGVLGAASELGKSKIEGAFTPSVEKIARVGTGLLKKIAGTHIGYSLYVRVRYEKYASGIFGSGREEKHSKSWSQWGQDGQDGKGHFFYREDLTKQIVKKVMEWRVRLFVREGI